MELKEILTDDDAVSPVIGVILMVAITVILAAVIATFVLGLGEGVSNTAPNADFQFAYDNSTGDPTVTATHTAGPGIEAGTLSVSGAAEEPFTNLGYNSSELVSAGDSIVVNESSHSLSTGERLRIIWAAEGDSATIANYDIPAD